MAQYQTFPDAVGASRTLDKLRALKLPDLAGKRFLDIGCNEGFFCGFAHSCGATRVVGIDNSRLFIDRAKERFPGCEFLLQDWDRLPDGEFDVVLLASAIHYAQDQPDLIRRLVDKLSADGVLVLELGVVPARDSVWQEVERGIDRRTFPSMMKLREVLAEYAWKWMGPSVMQQGDPVSRHVMHISRRRPVAYLLMQPPGYGKTSIATHLFPSTSVPVLSGDEMLSRIAKGSLHAGDGLKRVVEEEFSPFRIDRLVQRVFEDGAGPEFLRLCTESAGGMDFALDLYVPADFHGRVEEVLAALGYFPIRLEWNRVSPSAMSDDVANERIEGFLGELASADTPRRIASDGGSGDGTSHGFVDEIRFDAGKLTVRGWALGPDGQLPDQLQMKINGATRLVKGFERQSRPDVQRHLRLLHDMVGYQATIEIEGIVLLADIGDDFEVSIPGQGPLRLNERVRRGLASAGQAP